MDDDEQLSRDLLEVGKTAQVLLRHCERIQDTVSERSGVLSELFWNVTTDLTLTLVKGLASAVDTVLRKRFRNPLKLYQQNHLCGLVRYVRETCGTVRWNELAEIMCAWNAVIDRGGSVPSPEQLRMAYVRAKQWRQLPVDDQEALVTQLRHMAKDLDVQRLYEERSREFRENGL